ncbi:MAG: hypothetical protein IPM13_11670 [Phycisphaerales bacterium]|nr:hypothetical protein [Phycisphaerales bacterium]
MNYLSHYVFNHQVCGLPREPGFVAGVALPDLWLRFSRRRRIRWRCVRSAEPRDARESALREGLLNHAEADRAFHALPLFLTWHRAVRDAAGPCDVHPAMVDFLSHVAVELALDHHLLSREPTLVDEFYDAVAGCDADWVEVATGRMVGVDTSGLGEVVRAFVRRRFIRVYATHRGLSEVVHVILELARFPHPPTRVVGRLISEALVRVSPAAVWAALREGGAVPVAAAGA